jgi:kynurenine formamidase
MSAPKDKTQVLELARRYRTWGKWGPDDQIGALNSVTPARVAAAAALVRRGQVFSLSLPFDMKGPQTGAFGRVNPIHLMTADGGDSHTGTQDEYPEIRWADDALFLGIHSATHWDALAHIFHEGKMYNGYSSDAVTSQGASRSGVEAYRDKMVGRGVLLDLPRHFGTDWLQASQAVQAGDLEACVERQGVEVGEGDFLLVRTGQLAQTRAEGAWGEYAGGAAPGFGISAAEFFCERGVAAVAVDTWGAEVLPNETPDVFQPLHIILLNNAGITLGEMWDMEELAADCADDGVYEFMLVAPPLQITGGTGSPVNPQAIK